MLENQSADFVKKILNELQLIENLNVPAEELKKEMVIGRICEMILKTDMVYHFGQLDQLLELADYHAQHANFVASSQVSTGSLAVTNSHSSIVSSTQPPLLGSAPALSQNSATAYSGMPSWNHGSVSGYPLNSGFNNGPPSASPHTPKSAVELFKSLFNSPISSFNPNPSSSSSSLYSLSLAPIIKITFKTFSSKEQLIQIILHAAGKRISD